MAILLALLIVILLTSLGTVIIAFITDTTIVIEIALRFCNMFYNELTRTTPVPSSVLF